MKYSHNIDYLISSIIYLGTHSYYWARSPSTMASELSLDSGRLESVFDGFPGIFRKSKRLADNGQHYYALQARYAQRKGGDTEDPDKLTFISALDAKKLELLIGFVTKMADDERASFRGWVANGISVVAVLVSATAVIWAATLKVAPLINGATAG